VVPNWSDPKHDARNGANGRILPGSTYGSHATDDDAATLWIICCDVPAAHDGSCWAS